MQLVIDGNVRNASMMFLDDKPQRIDIDAKPHIFRFVELFRTLLINGHPFRADFGGQPMVVYVKGVKHYLRLTSLPRGVQAGQPPPSRDEIFREIEAVEQNPERTPEKKPERPDALEIDDDSQDANKSRNLDRFLNVMPSPSVPKPEKIYENKVSKDKEESPEKEKENSTPEVDVKSLWASLVGAGLIKKDSENAGIPGLENTSNNRVEEVKTPEKMDVDERSAPESLEKIETKVEEAKETPLAPVEPKKKIIFEPKIKKIDPVFLESRHPTIKE